MTERLEFYRCETCGNLVQVILPSVGELVCCNKPMSLLHSKKSDEELQEKHVPVFVKNNDGEEVHVGTTLHPMTEEHYIQFIETLSENKNRIEIRYFAPMCLPIMELRNKYEYERAQAYCNIHGLWEGEHD